jgi:hypothetical protein
MLLPMEATMRIILSFVLAAFCTQTAFAQAKRKVRKDSDASAIKSTDSQGSGLFLDWPTSDFDWFAGPVFGFKYSDVSADNQPRTKTMAVEGGLAGGLTGIPVVPGNPGFQVAPDVGMARGYVETKATFPDDSTVTEKDHYTRQWAGIGFTTYVHWFRYRLDLRTAKLTFARDRGDSLHSQKMGNDFGVLILPWLSEHYTLNLTKAYTSENDELFLSDADHWLHTRMFFDFMSFVLDLGPGFTQTTEYGGGDDAGRGHTDYFLARFGLNPFWKLVADGQAKYVYNSSDERLGIYADTRLPEDELNEPSTLAMPEDSFMGTLFLGVKDIFFGIGAGWRQNVQVLNVSRKGGAEKQTKRDQGFGLYYEVRF